MLYRLYRVILCFLLAMQPASKSLSTDLYFRLAETGQPMLVTLMDTAAAELTNSAVELTNSAVEHAELEKTSSNFSDADLNHRTAPVFHDPLSQLDNQLQVANESPDNLKSSHSHNAFSKEIEDDQQTEKSNENNTESSQNLPAKENNSSTELEIINKADVAPTSSEVQEEIPSFAEWAQKQLEEAEKKQEGAVNHSSQSSPGTVSSSVSLKVRSKNYASPDCGAKIVAANPESGSSGFVLSPSRDEYMLNTCNSRIWFIVELCEAIQAKKVEIANFELFSSTPKNFSVYVSDRFPTREWASVGQFIAKDERDIQTFNLHPHLFGKFLKVEVHSYYGSEHYCPISLFRVYGTSEFEVFETENSPQSQSNQSADDDDDDEILESMSDKENLDISRNLFGSARDAVMSIMKKAAEVLVKGGDSKNSSENTKIEPLHTRNCKTPSHIIVCDNCSNSVFTDVYDLMSCEGDVLNDFISSPFINNALCNSDMCQQYGLDFKSKRTSSLKTEIASYISALLMPSYVAALCNMLAIVEKKVVLNTSYETDLNVTTNLTIEKKVQQVAESGTLNELLQHPFAICVEDPNHPSCKNKPVKTLEGGIVPSITSSAPSSKHVENGSLTDIKPTKTLQKDPGPIEPSVANIGKGYDNSNVIQLGDIQSNEQALEASMLSNIEQKETEMLGTNESNKHIDESVKDFSSESESVKTEDKELSTVVAPPEVDAEAIQLESIEDGHMKLSTQDQITLDNLLTELEQGHSDPATPSPHNSAPTLAHQGQKESVFLRLSNRIKALERNMSLSGQYLEELSRRYKKQMEEMQKTFEKTLVTLGEESKKAEEREHKSSEEMLLLQLQIAQLSTSVSSLLADRESLLGSASLLKITLFQIFLTIVIVYILRKNTPHKDTAPVIQPRVSKTNETLKESKFRRRSTEEITPIFLGEWKQSRKRRPSEEALTITRRGVELCDKTYIKLEKKKKKRKSPIFHRSNSIAVPTHSNLKESPKSQDGDVWFRPDMNGSRVEDPIALDEAEFVAPELEPVDFSRMGEMKSPTANGIAPKKEFPKTNGSIFGKKTPDPEKSEKMRRLSSPAFFRAALHRNSSKSGSSEASARVVEGGHREKERGSPQLSTCTWSSIGDVSQTSSLAQTNSPIVQKKKSKAKSFKNMIKKVF